MGIVLAVLARHWKANKGRKPPTAGRAANVPELSPDAPFAQMIGVAIMLDIGTSIANAMAAFIGDAPFPNHTDALYDGLAELESRGFTSCADVRSYQEAFVHLRGITSEVVPAFRRSRLAKLPKAMVRAAARDYYEGIQGATISLLLNCLYGIVLERIENVRFYDRELDLPPTVQDPHEAGMACMDARFGLMIAGVVFELFRCTLPSGESAKWAQHDAWRQRAARELENASISQAERINRARRLLQRVRPEIAKHGRYFDQSHHHIAPRMATEAAAQLRDGNHPRLKLVEDYEFATKLQFEAGRAASLLDPSAWQPTPCLAASNPPAAKPEKRRGRHKPSPENVARDNLLVAAWKRAREAGTYKGDFAKDNRLSVREVDKVLDRVEKRLKRSSDKKQK